MLGGSMDTGYSNRGALFRARVDSAIAGMDAVAAIKDRVIDEKDCQIAELQRQLAELRVRAERAVHERDIHMTLSMSLLTMLGNNPTAAPILERARKDLISELLKDGISPTPEFFDYATFGLGVRYPSKVAGFKKWVSSKEKLSLSASQEASPVV